MPVTLFSGFPVLLRGQGGGETLQKPGQTGLTGWPFQVEVAKVRGTLDMGWGQTRYKEAASR